MDGSDAFAYSILILLIVIVAVVAMFGLPIYYVWSSEQAGKAELARATFNRQIAVQEAQAKDDSATLLAQAEVKRAEGVAKANQIIGVSLTNNEAYLRYLYIQNLGEVGNNREVIYVPTEAGLPILEASRNIIPKSG